uniref:Uncharacterized protein n=1 Tax=Arundo donax TaxID=35708 RepID=A0A0A9GMX3_ARUDO
MGYFFPQVSVNTSTAFLMLIRLSCFKKSSDQIFADTVRNGISNLIVFTIFS